LNSYAATYGCPTIVEVREPDSFSRRLRVKAGAVIADLELQLVLLPTEIVTPVAL
jgi:hypothetical protein